MKLLEMVTRLEASEPRTMCWRPMRAVVTWSIQTMSALLIVIASPPQTYLGLRSVIATFLGWGVSSCGGGFGRGRERTRFCSLDDDVVGAADNAQSLSFDYSGGAGADEGFVGFDCYAEHAGFVAVGVGKFFAVEDCMIGDCWAY